MVFTLGRVLCVVKLLYCGSEVDGRTGWLQWNNLLCKTRASLYAGVCDQYVRIEVHRCSTSVGLSMSADGDVSLWLFKQPKWHKFV